MNKQQLELIENMLHWRKSVLNSDFTFEKSIGVESIEDLLDNISACDNTGKYYSGLAEELISRLNREELEEIKHYLINEKDFADVNFESLSVKYYI